MEHIICGTTLDRFFAADSPRSKDVHMNLPAGLRRTDIGCEQFERFLKTYRFVWALRSRLIVTICLNCASQNFLTYSHTYTYLL